MAMPIDTPLRLDPTTAVAPGATGGTAAGAAAPPTDFRNLLESLERLVAEHKQLGAVQNADQLQDALRTADAGFVTAMDLRRQLEHAFRQRLP